MRSFFSRSILRRLGAMAVLFFVAFTMLAASNPDKDYDRIGHKLMCPCGCAEILLECNHVGCPDSTHMIEELHGQLNSGVKEAGILSFFAQEYGPTVLAAPLRGGFDNVAWVVPFAVLGLGILAVLLVVRLWQRRYAAVATALPAAPVDAHASSVRDRIREETQYGE